MTAYYNEIDPYAAQWLRNLIDAGLVARGDVDERSIVDVQAADLAGYTQCHFFAGIGGWSFALRLAGWPDDRRVWTGSCPCQSLSSIGQRKGHADKRHLWPAFYRLIAERRPAKVFGEQVTSPDGREWLSGVRADLEAAGYAFGAADLCAAGVGAPHIRQRFYWLADSNMPDENGRASGRQQPLHHADNRVIEGLGDSEGWALWTGRQPWEQSEAIECEDGWRRVEPGASSLVAGIPARLDKIRGYGNAIVPQLAAEFIGAAMNAQPGGPTPSQGRGGAPSHQRSQGE